MHRNYFGQVITPKDKVKNAGELKRGQHIAFFRGGYFHHAIIEEVELEQNKVHTIEYNLKVLRQEYKIDEDYKIEDFYLVKHDYDSNRYSEKVTMQRAEAGLEVQDKYHPLYRNCEHFANHCVLGEAGSGQSVQYWRMFVLLIGRFLGEICLFLFKFGMVTLLAEARPIAEGTDKSRAAWSLILQVLLASVLEGCFMVYDFHEAIMFSYPKVCCCSKEFWKAVGFRIALAIVSLGLMSSFSCLAIRTTDINHPGIILLAGSFGTDLGYFIVIGFQACATCCKKKKKVISQKENNSQLENHELPNQQGNVCERCNRKMKAKTSSTNEDENKVKDEPSENFVTWITKPRTFLNCSYFICLIGFLNLTSFVFYSATYVNESWWNVQGNGKIKL